MHTEFEATFLAIDKDAMRAKLKSAGATLVHPEYLMKRMVFHPPIGITGGWMRVRQEAEKITMSLKIVDGQNIEDQKEAMLEIHDFDEGVLFLESIGAKRKAYQETRREMWKLGDVECTLDTWPGLNPFLEVEGPTEEDVQSACAALALDYTQAMFCEVSSVYEKELGIPPDIMCNHTPVITFEHPPQKYVG